jgi:stearoyl-CoA desaturase (Delta-9 desaturase)
MGGVAGTARYTVRNMSSATNPAAGHAPGPDDVEPVANETRDRIITGVMTAVPILALFVVGWQVWNRYLHWSDLVVFAILYVATAAGVTVGFHRHFTHRSFKAGRAVRATLAILGSAAIEGPIVSWVADHRKHHAFSDHEGDPHSPHVDHGHGWRGAFRGLVHAHVGWLFLHNQRGARARYAPDLLADPLVTRIDRLFVAWALGGLGVAFALGWLIGGSPAAGLTGLLWGGAVRLLVVHHVTYSINSLCHFFGKRRFATDDESRNLAWLAPFSLGEAWHNNHHAFPTSAVHGLARWQFDPSALIIRALERAGLVWDVVRVSERRQAAKLVEAPGRG